GKLAGDEYQGLAERGGTLRLKVQAGDGAPREFATAIKPPHVDPAAGPGIGGKRVPAAGPTQPGSVNVWDKLGGGKGAGRDDPTQ
ncbi:MAG TPA: hypothetical protein VH165_14010, partial [Kofleriaceae bacterium]|nr:hypothetical protein [Kofleriaceae bacterium]